MNWSETSMEKIIYVIRHCSAEGQAPNADLTTEGISQAKMLVNFFEGIMIDRIITSPFVRALKSAGPLADAKGLQIEQDGRLSERVLSSDDLKDWLVKLEETFLNLHLKFEGGESSIEAMNRVRNVVDGLEAGSRTVLVTHGNLMALLLSSFDQRFGFKEWKELTNPDVFLIRIMNDEAVVERIWEYRS